MMSSALTIAGRTFPSRLLIGTGKYPSLEVTRLAFEAAAPAMVTVAVRRVDLARRGEGSVLDLIEAQRLPILPNTAG
jgi:thiazole synthase